MSAAKSWYSFKRVLATGHFVIKDPLRNAIAKKIRPLFDCLSSQEFLAACERCKTQNVNESFHNTLWTLSPKYYYNSVLETQFSLHVIFKQ